MLILLFLAAATGTQQPAIFDVTGMPPQLAIIRADAAKNGWIITCEGRSGEEGVLRLNAAPGAASQNLRAYFDDPNHVGSSTSVGGFGGRPLPASCNREALRDYGSDELVTALAYSAPQFLTQLVAIAKECGFAHAFIRPLRNTDPGIEQLPFQDGWQVIDAGEDVLPHYGPTICYLQISNRRVRKEVSPKGPLQKP